MTTFQTLPNGFKIPDIGLGTACRDPEFEQALDKALEIGYRHFDSAFVYQSEALIGRILNKWLSAGKLKREDLFITSKYLPKPDEDIDVHSQINKTLADLQLDYVDLYLVHRPMPDPAINAKIWKILEELVEAGKVKYIGVSNFSIEEIDQILNIARIKPVNLQIKLHLYEQKKPLVEYCKKNDITVVAYSPLGAPGRKHDQPVDIMNDEVVQKMAKKYNKTPAQVLLRFAIQQNIVPIPKSQKVDRLKENFNVFDFILSEEDLNALKALDRS